MTSLPSTMAKFGPPRSQTNYTSLAWFCRELSKNVPFTDFELLCRKLWTCLSNFAKFYHAFSPNMVMLPDPKLQISKIFNFGLILH